MAWQQGQIHQYRELPPSMSQQPVGLRALESYVSERHQKAKPPHQPVSSRAWRQAHVEQRQSYRAATRPTQQTTQRQTQTASNAGPITGLVWISPPKATPSTPASQSQPTPLETQTHSTLNTSTNTPVNTHQATENELLTLRPQTNAATQEDITMLKLALVNHLADYGVSHIEVGAAMVALSVALPVMVLVQVAEKLSGAYSKGELIPAPIKAARQTATQLVNALQ